MMRIVCAFVLLLACSIPLCAQNLIVNGSFEEPVFGSAAAAYYGAVPGWAVTGPSSAWNSSQLAQCPGWSPLSCFEVQRQFEGTQRNQDGAQWLELDISQNVTVYQDVATVPNQRYRIQYRDATRGCASSSRIDILWNGQLLAWTTPTSTNFREVHTEVTATGAASRLGFRGAGPSDGCGDLIDDVQLLPIDNAGNTLGYTYYIAQFADGGAWDTTVTVTNESSGDASVFVFAYAANGTQYKGLGGTGTLKPFEQRKFTGAGGGTTQTGWIRVQSTRAVRVNSVYRQRVSGRADQEAAVSAREPATRVVVPFDNTPGFATGVALANISAKAIVITVTGRVNPTDTAVKYIVPLNSVTQTSFVLTDKFTSLVGVAGTLEIQATDVATGLPAPFVAVGVRAQDSGAFATLPY